MAPAICMFAGGVHSGHFDTQKPHEGILCSQEQGCGFEQARSLPPAHGKARGFVDGKAVVPVLLFHEILLPDQTTERVFLQK